jgi:hypothetical protein
MSLSEEASILNCPPHRYVLCMDAIDDIVVRAICISVLPHLGNFDHQQP